MMLAVEILITLSDSISLIILGGIAVAVIVIGILAGLTYVFDKIERWLANWEINRISKHLEKVRKGSQ